MDELQLDHQLCFKLYALSRKVIAVYRPILEALDITYPQYLVLLVLWEVKSITVKELGVRLYLDSGTLTPLLKRLEQKGILSRQRDIEDERSVVITLKPAGRSLLQDAKKIPEALGNCISLGQSEYQQLKGRVDKLLTQLTTA
ncbi:MAG: MarR family transcriptional regulator [Puia sp.]|nr:MarR family transcriptional regulator [Puia sp.]